MAAPSLPPSGYWQRIVYIFMPLFLLLLFLGVIRLWGGEETAVSPPSATTTPPATPTSLPAPTETDTGNAATPLPPTPTAQPATPLPADNIILLGPPAGSTFPANTPITLFWQWPHPLTDEQQFSVYWQQDKQTQLLGRLTEPNFGDLFQLQTTPTIVGNAVWWIVLETNDATIESPQRQLLISAQ
ncbi:MAG: hypothetical protein H6668_01075 [Ardenticatenaceae bacterium]|nr:hypothetical protein [Ardenticatenaceae bacterium]